MTEGEVAHVGLQTNTTEAIVNVPRVIATVPYHFLDAVWRAKKQNPSRSSNPARGIVIVFGFV